MAGAEGAIEAPAGTPQDRRRASKRSRWRRSAALGGVFVALAALAQLAATASAAQLGGQIVGLAPAPGGAGYWLGGSDGGVFAFGSAAFHGSLSGTPLSAPIVGIAAAPTGGGYWLAGADGGVYAFGDAGYFNSLPGLGVHPNAPIVAIAATPDARGYWLAGADGGVYAFGDAGYFNSLPGLGVHPNAPIVAIAATPDARGYWLAGADGGVYAFGDAGYFNSLPRLGVHPNAPIVAIAARPAGRGHWLVGADGGVFAFGDAPSLGSLPGQGTTPRAPVVGIAATSTGGGYWLVGADGGVFAFGDAKYANSVPGIGIGPAPGTPGAPGAPAGGGAAGGGVSRPPPATGIDNGHGPPPATCATSSLKLGGITVEASCFTTTGPGRYGAAGRIRINGLDLVLTGSGEVALNTNPGQLELKASGAVDLYAGTLRIYHGDLDWQLTKLVTLKLPGGLKIKGLDIDGDITLRLSNGAVEADANAKLGGAPFSVSGAISLELAADGLKLDSLRLNLATDLPIGKLTVKRATLAYSQTNAGDVWTGSVKVTLPQGPTLDGGLTVTNGTVSEVSISASDINEPVGEVVYLQSLGLRVKLGASVSATGLIGLSAGPAIQSTTLARLMGEVTVEFADPFVLRATGALTLVDQQIADATLEARIPGGVTFKGRLTAEFGPLGVSGGLDGSVERKHFSAAGNVMVHAGPFHAQGAGLVNEVGIAGCGQLKVRANAGFHAFERTISFGGARRWKDGRIDVFGDSCGADRLRQALSARGSALGAPAIVRIPSGTGQLNLIAGGASAPPAVLVRHGQTLVVVTPGATGGFGRGAFLAIADAARNQTAIAIAQPPSGTLEVSAPPGAPALESVASSLSLPRPLVHVRVRSAGGRRFRLSWQARAIRGQALSFADVDARGQRGIVSSRRSRGQATFTALDDGARGAHALRVVVTEDGLVRKVLDPARFTPPPVRLAAPRMRVTLGRRLATIRWRGVADAASYQIAIAIADGRHLFFSEGRTARALRIRAARRVTVRMRAVSGGLEAGPFATASTAHAR